MNHYRVYLEFVVKKRYGDQRKIEVTREVGPFSEKKQAVEAAVMDYVRTLDPDEMCMMFRANRIEIIENKAADLRLGSMPI